MNTFFPWMSIILTTLGIIGAIVGFVWARSKFEATIATGLDKIDTRINSIEDKYDGSVSRCKEKQDNLDGRIVSLENMNIMTFESHSPVQEACRHEIFKLIEMQEKKADKSEETIESMKVCLHRMDKNIATLLAYSGKDENRNARV